jgi:hypothetical protein
MEFAADFLHPLADGRLRDPVAGRDRGHSVGLQFGVAEGEVEAVDGKPGAVLSADVADEATGELQGIGVVGLGGGGGLLLSFVDLVVREIYRGREGVFVEGHRGRERQRAGRRVNKSC